MNFLKVAVSVLFVLIIGVFLLMPLECVATFNELKIECIPVKHCPIVLKLLTITYPNSAEMVSFLRLIHCGYSEGEVKVWCSLFKYCTTPDARNGTCKNIKHCHPYIQLLKRADVKDPVVKSYLREFRCSTKFDAEIKVCCAEEGEFVPENSVFINGIKERLSDLLPNPELVECGKQSTDNKIFGGTDTNLDEFPWMALLKYYNKGSFQYGCSGSLINERNVVTAAHCVDPYITKRKGVGEIYSVVLGEYDTRNNTDCIYEESGKDCADPLQEIFVESIKLHPGYKTGLLLNDIAIIRLTQHIKYTDFIQPICLPPPSLKLEGNQTVIISGWGRTPEYIRSPIKQKASIQNVDKEKCNMYDKNRLNREQICAGMGDGIDSCYGDSGGPLMLEKSVGNIIAVTFLVGITSYGYGKVCGNYPGVYTFIPPYIDWIVDNIE